jgi:hypothetical protein
MLHDQPPQSPPPPTWKIRVYRVRSQRSQARVLAAFDRMASSDIALSTSSSGPERFVVADYSTAASEARLARVILAIDPVAVRVYECESPVDQPEGRAWPGFRVPLADVDDAELLHRAQDGEYMAFDVLCSRHSYAARRLARQLGLGRAGPRVVSDAFARALVACSSDREFVREVFGIIRVESRRSRSSATGLE